MFDFIKRLLGISTNQTQDDPRSVTRRYESPSRHEVTYSSPKKSKPQVKTDTSNSSPVLDSFRERFNKHVNKTSTTPRAQNPQKPHIKRTVLRVWGEWPDVESSIVEAKVGHLPQRLVSITKDAQLKITPHTERDGYTLLSRDLDGVDSKFDDENSADEAILGIDFGTSNLKAIVRTQKHQFCLAVPFRDMTGINAYLLPTVLYQRDDESYTLEPTDKIAHASLKLALMKNPSDKKIQGLTVAYIALAIRHTRAWLFNRFKDEFHDAHIAWEMRMGCPSDKDQDEIVSVWHELLVRAWVLSEKSGCLTDSLIEDVMKPEVFDPDSEIAAYCRAYPEVFAAGQGFRKIHPAEVRYMTDIIIVDVGSGTVDISAFALSDLWRDERTRIGVFCCEVRPLGTSKYYETQLTYLRDLFMQSVEDGAFPVNQPRLKAFVSALNKEIGEALREPLRDSFKDHCVGFNFSKPVGVTPEYHFANEVRRHLLKIRRGAYLTECLSRDQVSRMEVVLTGGGSRSNFYKEAFLMDDGKMYKNFEWLSPQWINFKRIEDIPEIREQMDIPISSKDYDRLLVAFGLQISDLGESFTPSKVVPMGVRTFEEKYIDKDKI